MNPLLESYTPQTPGFRPLLKIVSRSAVGENPIMRSPAILLLSTLLLCLLTLACGYGSHYNPMNGAVPKINQLTPQNVIANSGAFTLTIEGSGFTSGSIVYWNTIALAASRNSSTQLTVGISAAMIANAGTVAINVHSAGGNSNIMMFDID